ncbi:magnesium transporter [Marchantia polymorpha subsp. ruderalis]|uniref:Magnesium transporter n=2 Tax=Marchantia polymorpha TaxID=3197 RepID=A0AAF6BIF4_MARPO|nr:hypothetical protein MARPO_0032s0166 [Marchantia polymorpha]BBN11788.1 hypothetical protein Mp_5g14750 [Marchantia polymorpha subsp. ruderalis]|eukprot:PTQ42005.1 hypothetical protein MARPO_0032s0166 [Marchantia polymorpha]
MAGRLSRLAIFQQSLQSIVYVEYGLATLESGNRTPAFTGVLSRSYFSSSRAKGGISQHEKPTVKSPVVDTKSLRLLASLDKYLDISNFRYWSASWLKPLAGSLRREKKENLKHEAWIWAKHGQKSLTLRRIDQQDHRYSPSVIRRNYKNGDKPSALEGGVKYSVIRVDRHGVLQPLELSTSQLGLHPRDIDLLSSSSFIPQRATIAVRNELVLVRMENVRAIVCKDHVLLFDARHPRTSRDINSSGSFSGGHGAADIHRARDAFAKSLAEEARQKPSSLLDSMPFHLRMLECLLEETSNFFHQKVDRLKLVVERMLEELTDDVSMGGLQRLLPLRRAVTEVEHDVRDAHEAMDQVLRSDDILLALCLCKPGRSPEVTQTIEHDRTNSPGEREEHHHLRQAAADMLLTYQREVDDAGGVLEELRKGMEAAQEIWELGLDTTRNRIIRMNLYISISTLSISLATLPAAFFGMNLVSGFEDHPTLFYTIVACASVAPLALCTGILVGFRLWPKVVDKRRAQDLAGLRDLLQHLDSIDDIIQSVAREVAGKALTRKEFQDVLRSHPSSRFMRQKELDLIFRMFDTNRNGLLEVDEWNSQTSTDSESPNSRVSR